MRFFILIGIVLFSFTASAQNKKRKAKGGNEPTSQQPNSVNPFPTQEYGPKKKSKRNESSGPTYNAEKQYYERVEAVAKQRRKAEKEMLKPQHSDPTYFGHKRPPKKRKPGKMKYCKECGLRH